MVLLEALRPINFFELDASGPTHKNPCPRDKAVLASITFRELQSGLHPRFFTRNLSHFM
jgi:hypothetical protein